MHRHTPWHWRRSEELICALVLSLLRVCSPHSVVGVTTEYESTTCFHEQRTQTHTVMCLLDLWPPF